MVKETKNILTREACQKELARWAKGELRSDAVLFGIMLLIFVPLFALCVYIAKYLLVLGIVFASICTVAPIIFVYRMICDMIKIRLVKQGAFSIVRDTVCRIARGEMPKKYPESRHTVNAVYFTRHGRCTSLKAPLDLTSLGDECYLVILHSKRDQIVFAYHSMIYDCKDF